MKKELLMEILNELPEEQILHSCMEEEFHGHPSQYWLGWNEYRRLVMMIIKKKLDEGN